MNRAEQVAAEKLLERALAMLDRMDAAQRLAHLKKVGILDEAGDLATQFAGIDAAAPVSRPVRVARKVGAQARRG